jgi:hypothetical protein
MRESKGSSYNKKQNSHFILHVPPESCYLAVQQEHDHGTENSGKHNVSALRISRPICRLQIKAYTASGRYE